MSESKTQQSTHFADNETLAHIARLERDRAELIEMVRRFSKGYSVSYGEMNELLRRLAGAEKEN